MLLGSQYISKTRSHSRNSEIITNYQLSSKDRIEAFKKKNVNELKSI